MFAVLDLKLVTFFHLPSHLEQINSLFQTTFTLTVRSLCTRGSVQQSYVLKILLV